MPETDLPASAAQTPTTWDWLWSAGLILIGAGDIIAVNLFWPAVLILAGVAMLVNLFSAR